MNDLEEQEVAPYLDKVRCWMVEVHGGGEDEMPPLGLDAVAGFMVSGGLALDRKGVLAAAVRKVMEGYRLSDSGMGSDCWMMGCHCTCLEARRLVRDLRDRFEKALKAGLIRIEIHPWTLRWKSEQ